MKELNKEYTILSPAGSWEQLKAAVNNNCDAVYLGLDSFNARMKAPNFTAQNISEAVDYCHFFGVKVYVAVNTSIKNQEFAHAVETLILAYKNNADGVIVTDLALLKYAAQLPKPFDIVASTQLNVHDGFGARFLKELGATTVVCARECSFAQIAEITATGIAVECFLHGALCVCQSGQCLFSSMIGGNSGNRGLCAQPCRKLYRANVGKFVEGGYLLSAADICGLQTAEKMLESGVTTFKVEGRNRRAEYAGVTAEVYSEFFAKGFIENERYITELREIFNRGNLPSNNYLDEGNNGIIYPYAQNHIGVPVGVVHGGGVIADVPLLKGDGLKIMRDGAEICGGIALKSGTGFIPCEFSDKVSDGMIVRRTTSEALCNQSLDRRRKLSVSMFLQAFAEKNAVLTLRCGCVTVTAEADQLTQRAHTNPTKVAELRQQLCKIGDLSYTITDIICEIDDIFVPKSQINQLRRRAFELLSSAIVADYNKQFQNRQNASLQDLECAVFDPQNKPATPCLSVVCYTEEQVLQVENVAHYIIYKPHIIDKKINAVCSSFLYLDLPSFADLSYIAKLIDSAKVGIVCHNIGQVQFARTNRLRYIAGAGLNIFNDRMVQMFNDADTFFYSQELTLREIAEFQNKGGLTFVDGSITLMKLLHCPFKLNFDCDCTHCHAQEKLVYTDELRNAFSVVRRKDSRCTFELINGKKLSVVNRLRDAGRYCVDFDPDVVSHYVKLNSGETSNYVENRPYTKGRLYNKIN